MIVYTFDRSLDGLLTAVFDAYALNQLPDELVGESDVLPLFCETCHQVVTADDKAARVWSGMERRLSKEGLRMVTVSFLSESPDLYTPLFHFVYKIFRQPEGSPSLERNYADQDVLFVNNRCRQVGHEAHRMLQFVRFQKAKDGTYLGVISPDHDVLPLIIHHFQDRFRDQPWLIFDAKRKYGFYKAEQEGTPIRITFEDNDALPFSLETGQLNEELLSQNDQLFQELWRTYFKAICIRERMNPRKQLKDMPRRYWRYLTEKQTLSP